VKVTFSLCFEAGDGIFGIFVAVLPPIFTASCRLEVEIGESPDDWYIHDAMDTACVFLTSRTNDALLSATLGVVSVKFLGALVLLSRSRPSARPTDLFGTNRLQPGKLLPGPPHFRTPID
jgi:hypothetical protein